MYDTLWDASLIIEMYICSVLWCHISIKESHPTTYCLVGGDGSKVFVFPAQASVFLRVNTFGAPKTHDSAPKI